MSEHKELRGLGADLRPHCSRGDSRLSRIVSGIDEEDATSRYREEEADNHIPPGSHDSAASSIDERTIVAWEPDDPENPYNWSNSKKTFILVMTMLTIINSTMGSALPSNATPFFMKEWGVESQTQKVLPISVFLIGYIFGPAGWAPMSEQFGRRWLTIVTFFIFCLWTMACALAPNWPAFLVFRFFVGVFASAPIAIVTGIMADMYGEPRTRGRAMAAFMVTTLFGPLLAPIISGFCSPTIGWRWTFWVGLIYAGATMALVAFLRETYGPVLLLQRAKHIRKHDPKANVVAPHEIDKPDLRQLMSRVLTRPLRMIFFELIVTASCMYLALVYAIFYMTFQAFPLIYQGLYGLSPGVCGLTFLTIGAGAFISLPIFWWYDGYLHRATERNASWTHQEEYRRLPLACLGGPLFVISLFWLGWTSRESIPFWVPMLAGIPFGLGFMLIFMALLNYLTDAYEIFAASANAAASCCRSLLATVLPFASVPMFSKLGINGACSLLGGLSCVMCIIPFIFIWKGERIRAGSRFCIYLRERKEEMARKVEEQRRRQAEAEARSSGLLQVSKEEV